MSAAVPIIKAVLPALITGGIAGGKAIHSAVKKRRSAKKQRAPVQEERKRSQRDQSAAAPIIEAVLPALIKGGVAGGKAIHSAVKKRRSAKKQRAQGRKSLLAGRETGV